MSYTITTYAYYKDSDGALAAPSPAPTCTIYNNAGESQGAATVTSLFTGCYQAVLADQASKYDAVAKWTTSDTDYDDIVTLDPKWRFEIDDIWGVVETVVADVWSYATRTLSSFGTLVADIWSNTTRTVTNSGVIAIGSRVSADGLSVTVYPGENYSATYSNQLSFDLTGFPDLTDATIEFKGTEMGTLSMTVTNGGESTQTVYMEPSATDSAKVTLDEQKVYNWWDEAERPLAFVQVVRGSTVS